MFLQHLRTSNSWHLIWLTVIFSEILTTVISIILTGRVRADYLVVGGIISLIVASCLIYIIRLLRETEKALEEKTTSLQSILRSSTDTAIVVTGLDFHISYHNTAAVRLFSCNGEELAGKRFTEMYHDCSGENLPFERLAEIIRSEGERDVILERRNGDEIRYIRVRISGILGNDRNPAGFLFMARDITDRRLAEEQIRRLAFYDSLTGLPNRRYYQEQIARALNQARRRQGLVGVIFIDLDNFKRVNDTFGHTAGDRLLKAVAERLMKSLRGSDFVARYADRPEDSAVSRLGGDEFMVLLTDIAQTHDPAWVARRVLKDLSEPFKVSGQEIVMTASLGVSVYPEDGETPECLLKNADIAMYHAKGKGKNNFQFFSRSMNYRAFERLTLEYDLHKAIERKEFYLCYQPRIHVPSGRIIGVEALIRWLHPERGLLMPSEFIPLAEDTGLIVPIGEWVLRSACMQSRIWQNAGFASRPVAVNLSSRQFDKPDLAQVVDQALEDARLDPHYLELEITESAVMHKPKKAIQTLKELKKRGIHILIDDFGTGYSSMNYLRRIPFDALKLDRSFVMNVTTNSSDAAIVKAIIAMANNLSLAVIAEGVETEGQRDFLTDNGCHEMQGYLWSKPLKAKDLEKVMTKTRPLLIQPT